jgi:hypothetical protein
MLVLNHLPVRNGTHGPTLSGLFGWYLEPDFTNDSPQIYLSTACNFCDEPKMCSVCVPRLRRPRYRFINCYECDWHFRSVIRSSSHCVDCSMSILSAKRHAPMLRRVSLMHMACGLIMAARARSVSGEHMDACTYRCLQPITVRCTPENAGNSGDFACYWRFGVLPFSVLLLGFVPRTNSCHSVMIFVMLAIFLPTSSSTWWLYGHIYLRLSAMYNNIE